MKKTWKYVGIAALIVILALGGMAVIAYAQDPVSGTNGPFDFFGRFRQNLAGILGISVEQYDSAVVQARDQTLKDAVTEGWLTQDQADQMQQRMDQAPDAMPWGMGPGFGKHGRGMMDDWGMMGGRGMLGEGVSLLSVAAEQLGMTEADLQTALQGGKSIADVAAEKGIDAQTIADAYVAQLTTNLNQAVTDGKITQKQADWMVEQAQTQVTEQLNSTWQQWGPRGFRDEGGMVDVLSVAADTLGMTQSDLQAELKSGKTIADVAKAKGVDPQTIIDACIAQLTTKLNEAVANGTMTQAQADQKLEQAKTQVPEQINGTWEQWGPHGFPGGRGLCPPSDSASQDDA